MRGRKPTPPQLKVIAGTDRPDRQTEEVVSFDVLEDFPAPPACLNVTGAALWNDLGRELVAARVLQIVDLHMFEIACYAWQRYRAKAEAGSDINSAELTTLKAYLSEFGASPVARRKGIGNSEGKKENRFAKNGKREAS
jgi:phage terminase small subunit